MPTRRPARRTRRTHRLNPDPPQSLREYLRERDEAIAQGAFVAAGIDIAPEAATLSFVAFSLPDWTSYGYVFVFSNYPAIRIDAKSYHGRVDLPSISVALAERTGRVVTLELGRSPKTYDEMIAQGFTFVETWNGDRFVYVPTHFEDRGAVGSAFVKERRVSMRSPYKEYLLNDVSILRVPRKYRSQVRRLVLDALAHDDLNLYMQARELAALVSE